MTSGNVHYPSRATVYLSQPSQYGNYKFEFLKPESISEDPPIYKIVEVTSNSVGYIESTYGRTYLDKTQPVPEWYIGSWVNIGIPNSTGSYDWVGFQFDNYGDFIPKSHALFIVGKSSLKCPEDPDIRWDGSVFPRPNMYREYNKFNNLIRVERLDDDKTDSSAVYNIYINAHELR
jgi:hypothetical protein